MNDFTLVAYTELLDALIEQGYSFQTFEQFIKSPQPRSVILRHDVDARAHNSRDFARVQAKRGVVGTYYFRAIPQSWDEDIVREMVSYGHEIGYHYECLTTCGGNIHKALQDFAFNLENFRKVCAITTICMHGSPMSKYDSRDLWKHSSYRDYGIMAEPYFDVDYSKVFYLTDTGRRWDGEKFSVRDKVNSTFDLQFHTTQEIIRSCMSGQLPDCIMFTFHPQRWTDNRVQWTVEWVIQRIKNVVKRAFFMRKK
ncbi:MAG: hypothetical protein ACKO7B_15920 [Flavobacteriales bacterium]